jgi:hypothetical protein
LAAGGVVGVSGDAVVGIQPVEGLLQLAGGGRGVGGALLQGQVGVDAVQVPARRGVV